MANSGSDTLWFGVYGREYMTDEPAFFPEQEMPWAKALKQHFPVIKAALAPLMQDSNTDLQPYFDDALQYPPKNWKSIGFYFWGLRDEANAKRFPEIFEILEKIPGLVSASFSMLEPHSRILPHFGETNGVYRAHMGVRIPAQMPECGFTVKGESRSWQEGELLIFLDANIHAAHNDSDARRYILLVDVIRPEFRKEHKRICVQALSMLSFYWVIAHIPYFPTKMLHKHAHRIPRILIDTLILPFKLIWLCLWPLKKARLPAA